MPLQATPYIYLITAWIIFGVLHSVLASSIVKRGAMQLMQQGYKFYRILYSLLATASLLIVLHYHFSCHGFSLWGPPLIQTIVAFISAVAGLAIMVICIRTYFMDLSGIDALLGKNKPSVLQQGGMHAYVRHPLYFGTLVFVWAIFFGYPSLNNLISCICITGYTWVGMFFEEKKLVGKYGQAYKEYQNKVPGLLPLRFSKT